MNLFVIICGGYDFRFFLPHLQEAGTIFFTFHTSQPHPYPTLDKRIKIVNNINTGWQFVGLPDALRRSDGSYLC